MNRKTSAKKQLDSDQSDYERVLNIEQRMRNP